VLLNEERLSQAVKALQLQKYRKPIKRERQALSFYFSMANLVGALQ